MISRLRLLGVVVRNRTFGCLDCFSDYRVIERGKMMTFSTTVEGGLKGADEDAFPYPSVAPVVVVGKNLDVLFSHRVASVDDVLAYSGDQGAVLVVRILVMFAPPFIPSSSGLANILVVAR